MHFYKGIKMAIFEVQLLASSAAVGQRAHLVSSLMVGSLQLKAPNSKWTTPSMESRATPVTKTSWQVETSGI